MVWVVGEVVERTKDVGLIEHVFRKWGTSPWNVRNAVAMNPRTPVNLLRTLGNEATESEWSVREDVAKNPSTPVDTLRTLGNEQTEVDDDVREAAQEMLAKRGLT